MFVNIQRIKQINLMNVESNNYLNQITYVLLNLSMRIIYFT